MRGGQKSTEGIRRIGDKLAGSLEPWLHAWERSRILAAYTQLRHRLSGPPVPGMPPMTNLDPFVAVSLGLHLLVALLIYLLAAQALPLAARPPISVRILETKAQAPAPAREQKPIRRARKRKTTKRPRQQAKPRPAPPKVQPKPRPTPPKPVQKPVPKPIFTPKAIPRVAQVAPRVPSRLPQPLPKVAVAPPKARAPSPNLLLAQKALPPTPVKPFEAEAPPAGAPSEIPRSLATPPPSPAAAAPAEIAPLPAPSTTPSETSHASVPKELSKATLEGFQQPTGPVVVPERFLKGGKPQTTAGAAVALIDTSDPDFTEYFELIKRRVYAAWRYPKGVRGVYKVSVRFNLDRAGAAHQVKVVRSTNARLNQSAAEAMDRASPFPPIPEKFRALVGHPLTLIFTVTIQ
ncbi:MAG: TonB family protein [Candidatus Methylomirabilales bacterium]